MKGIYSIKSKAELKAIQSKDKLSCFGINKISLESIFRKPFKYKLYRYFKLLRKYEYLCYRRDNTKNLILSKTLSLKIKYCDSKKNRLGLTIGVEIKPFCCGASVRICHPNVIINGYTGESCVFHGNNVLGNKKTGDTEAIPRIGNNVDVGIGAMVIGDVIIADNVVIGAGAVVTKSFEKPGTVVAGVPAKEIR